MHTRRTRIAPRTMRSAAVNSVFRLAVFGAALAALPAQAQDPGYTGEKIVRVQIRDAADVQAMEALGAEAWECRPPLTGPADFRLPKGKLDALQDSGLTFRVLIEDLQAVADAEFARLAARNLEGGGAGGAWFSDYKDYAAISSYCTSLAAAYPATVTRISLGQSLQGREIFGLRIAAPDAPATRTAVFLNSLQHAREWITGMSNMYIADRLARCSADDPRIASLLNSVQFYIVPVSNPDGYAHTWVSSQTRFWRKNRRPNPNGSTGVDLNRNWGYQWGGAGASTSQGSDTYRGAAAFSEPETQVLRDFVLAHPEIRAHVDIHSYSQLILSPWGYTAALPPDHLLFADLNAMMVSAFGSIHGTQFVGGPINTTIYPASGGANDWTYGDRGILGWGFELRDLGSSGFALPPAQIIPSGEETFAAVISLAEAVAQPLRFTFPDGLPTAVESGAPRDIRVVVSPMAAVVAAASPVVRTRIGRTGDFSSVPLSHVSGTEYLATLPAATCGAEVWFAFEAATTGGTLLASPNAPAAAYIATTTQPGGAPCAPCAADFSRDGEANPDDLGDYINCYFSSPPCPLADVNADSETNPDDLGDFINAFFAGCS